VFGQSEHLTYRIRAYYPAQDKSGVSFVWRHFVKDPIEADKWASGELKKQNRSAMTENQLRKVEEGERKIQSITNQISRARQIIREAVEAGESVVGVKGAYGRVKEFALGGSTRQSEFEELIRIVQREIRPVLSGTTRFSDKDQKIIDTIVPGLGFIRNDEQVDAGLEQLQKILHKVDLVEPAGGKEGAAEPTIETDSATGKRYQFMGTDPTDPAQRKKRENWKELDG
jgi:hypothetical protein